MGKEENLQGVNCILLKMWY